MSVVSSNLASILLGRMTHEEDTAGVDLHRRSLYSFRLGTKDVSYRFVDVEVGDIDVQMIGRDLLGELCRRLVDLPKGMIERYSIASCSR